MEGLVRTLQATDTLSLFALSQCEDDTQRRAVLKTVSKLSGVSPTPDMPFSAHKMFFHCTTGNVCTPNPLIGGRADEMTLAARLNAIAKRRIAERAINM